MPDLLLVTGCAGFIGYHLCQRLLNEDCQVIGIDNLNDYYEVGLKQSRLNILQERSNFKFHRLDIADREAMDELFIGEKIGSQIRIIHLAAQAGVRYSLRNPASYIQSNIVGFFNLLENARRAGCQHLVYASSSSVYGGNTRLPFSVHDNVDHPVSLYAATKKSDELMAHVYSYTYGLPTTGLRFFTVYGPWGRPDMSYFIFTKAILEGVRMPVYNRGDMSRDFTYIDDIVEGVRRIIQLPPTPDPEWNSATPNPGASWVPYRIYNIGSHQPINLLEFIRVIEESIGKKALLDFKPMQVGDVKSTFADIEDLTAAAGFEPRTTIYEGIPRFIRWYIDYYQIKR